MNAGAGLCAASERSESGLQVANCLAHWGINRAPPPLQHCDESRVTTYLTELRNLKQAAQFIGYAGPLRCGSRGLHNILDYPQIDAKAVDALLVP